MPGRIIELYKTSVPTANCYLAAGYQFVAVSQESEPDTGGHPAYYVVAIVGRPEGVVHACPRCYGPMPDWDAMRRGSRNRMCATCFDTPNAAVVEVLTVAGPEL